MAETQPIRCPSCGATNWVPQHKGREVQEVAPETMERLGRCAWPGNILSRGPPGAGPAGEEGGKA